MAVAGGRSSRRVFWISFGLLTLLGSLWAMSSPLISVPDEQVHIAKAVAMAHGQLRGRDAPATTLGWPFFDAGTVTYFSGTADYASLETGLPCFAFNPEVTANCLVVPSEDHTPATTMSWTGNYPPLFYLLVGSPSLVLPPGPAMYAMRLIGVMLSAAVLAWGIVAARSIGVGASAGREASRRGSPGRPVLAGVALALTPMGFFLFGAVNPSGLEIAAALCLWLSLLAVWTAPSAGPAPRDLVRAVAAALLFVACRPLSPLLTLAVLAFVPLVAATPAALRSVARSSAGRLAGAVVVAGMLVSIGLVVALGSASSFIGQPQGAVSRGAAVTRSMHRVPFLAGEMIGNLGWRDTPLPQIVVTGWLVLVAVWALGALVVGTWRQRAGLVTLVVGILVFQIGAEAAKAQEVGWIWQGRYSLPLAVGVPVLSAWIFGSAQSRGVRRAMAGLCTISVAWAAGGLLIAHAVWMRRNVVGASHPILAYPFGTGWSPPVPAWLLAGMAVTASIAYGGWLLRLIFELPDRPPPESVAFAPPGEGSYCDRNGVGAVRA